MTQGFLCMLHPTKCQWNTGVPVFSSFPGCLYVCISDSYVPLSLPKSELNLGFFCKLCVFKNIGHFE